MPNVRGMEWGEGTLPGWQQVVYGLWRSPPDGAGRCGYLLRDGSGGVLIDPWGVTSGDAQQLGAVQAVVTTSAACGHEARALAAWLSVSLYEPAGVGGEPWARGHRYGGGDLLPADLTALSAPGADPHGCALWRAHAPSLLFLGDLLEGVDEGGRVRVRWGSARDAAQWQHTFVSVSRLVDDLPFEVACCTAGPPLVRGARESVRQLLGVPGVSGPMPPTSPGLRRPPPATSA